MRNCVSKCDKNKREKYEKISIEREKKSKKYWCRYKKCESYDEKVSLFSSYHINSIYEKSKWKCTIQEEKYIWKTSIISVVKAWWFSEYDFWKVEGVELFLVCEDSIYKGLRIFWDIFSETSFYRWFIIGHSSCKPCYKVVFICCKLSYSLFKSSIIHFFLSSQLSLPEITCSFIGETPVSSESVEIDEIRRNKYYKTHEKYSSIS